MLATYICKYTKISMFTVSPIPGMGREEGVGGGCEAVGVRVRGYLLNDEFLLF